MSEGDILIMLRRLNTRLDWNLGDSAILRLFGLQTQVQEYPEADAESAAQAQKAA